MTVVINKELYKRKHEEATPDELMPLFYYLPAYVLKEVRQALRKDTTRRDENQHIIEAINLVCKKRAIK